MLFKKILFILIIFPKRCLNDYYYRIVLFLNKKQLPNLNILNDDETISYILENKVSVSRFGDGEISWIMGDQCDSFQKNSVNIAQKLKEVLQSKESNLLICIPSTLQSNEGIEIHAKQFWTRIMHKQRFHILFMLTNNFYGNSLFTRPYIIYKDKKNKGVAFDKIKKIWENREVLIVEGEFTFFGINNDLLSSAKNVKRIIAPAQNAFESYDEILKEILKYDNKKLILLALGPTATILAYDLTKNGYQAIDIGHVDIEYEWYQKGAKKKVSIPGKYVNEIDKKIINDNLYIDNMDYKNSVVGKVNVS